MNPPSLAACATPIRAQAAPACMEKAEPAAECSNLCLTTALHSVTWLVIANLIGLFLATLLLIPQLNQALGEWTYGRWMPLHLDLMLYGWCSLPWVAWLFRVYRVEHRADASWARSTLWIWSCALGVGSVHWLQGGSSGKLFLDWQGYPRLLMTLAMVFLWAVLTDSFVRRRAQQKWPRIRQMALVVGLTGLFAVPWALYWAAGPGVYPPVNPGTGGPTGASLLESTLGILFLLLLIPKGLALDSYQGRHALRGAWILLALQALLSIALGHGNNSHHRLSEILGLSSLALWVPLLPNYFNAFHWPSGVDSWKRACLAWWGLLVLSACLIFLPGVLDHLKFTDGLVAHSHMAMAGFVSSLNLFLLSALLARRSSLLNRRWAFYSWNVATMGHVGVLFVAGWVEGSDPAFTMAQGRLRLALYSVRWICGALMLASSLHWWLQLRAACSTDAESARKDSEEPLLSRPHSAPH